MANSLPLHSHVQPMSSLLCQSQHEAFSAASPNLCTAFLLFWPLSPILVSRFHTDCAGKPRQPTSTGKSQVCQPFSLQLSTSCWYLLAFLSEASSHPSSHGTVSSTMMIFLSLLLVAMEIESNTWYHGQLPTWSHT